MPTRARAVVTPGDGTFAVEEVTLGDPGPGEVLVEIRASGVCHTDFDSMSWGRPLIMGHEGAGVVARLGEGVEHVAEGERVMLNWAIPCFDCFQCRHGAENICENPGRVPDERFQRAGGPLNASFQLGTMATHALVPRNAVVPVGAVEIPFASACIVGCGVMTGWGSVLNAAKVRRGESVAVLGTGGVGLSVIQGAVEANAGRIIAVDINPRRLEFARRFGATECVQPEPGDTDLARAAVTVRGMTGGRGVDAAFECVAKPELGPAPLRFVRNGGVAVGVSGIEQDVTIDFELFEWDKRYINPLYGQCRPFRDFPALLRRYAEGRLKLDEMVTRTYALDELGQAFDDMRAGLNAKGVLVMD